MDRMITLEINKENVFEVAESLLANAVNNRYNNDCFGLSDIRREMPSYYYLNKFYESLLELGYNPIIIFREQDEQYGAGMRFIGKEVNESLLKVQLSNDFSMVLEISEKEWQQAKLLAKK